MQIWLKMEIDMNLNIFDLVNFIKASALAVLIFQQFGTKKTTLSILPPDFTKHPTSVILIQHLTQ